MAVAVETRVTLDTTRVFTSIVNAWKGGKRRWLGEGGTSSSKTYSVLQFLIILARDAVSPILISVVSESLPHLRRGAIRDFFNILQESPDNNPYYSKTEFTYRGPGWKGVIEFFGADDSAKVRGPRRDILFINEGNNIPWETVRGLDIRTSKFTLVDWNPVSEFWVHENWLQDDVNAYSHSTYLDARPVLPAEVVANIESNKDKDPNWWNVYGLGKLGKTEGMVHPRFDQVDELPIGVCFYGMDFGFSSDPTVLVKNVIAGDNLYSKQMFYERRPMTNDDIAREMELLRVVPGDPIYCDPSEPKSAEEIRRKGWNISESEKGAGSKLFGIKKVNSFNQFWTKDSLDCIKDQRNYRWIRKREIHTGTEYWSEDTTHQWSHGVDARRYGVAAYQVGVLTAMPVWKY